MPLKPRYFTQTSKKEVDQLKIFIGLFDAPRRDIFKDASQTGLPNRQEGQNQLQKLAISLKLQKRGSTNWKFLLAYSMRPDGTFSKTQRKPVYLTGKRVKTGSKSLTFFLNLEKNTLKGTGQSCRFPSLLFLLFVLYFRKMSHRVSCCVDGCTNTNRTHQFNKFPENDIGRYVGVMSCGQFAGFYLNPLNLELNPCNWSIWLGFLSVRIPILYTLVTELFVTGVWHGCVCVEMSSFWKSHWISCTWRGSVEITSLLQCFGKPHETIEEGCSSWHPGRCDTPLDGDASICSWEIG